MTKIGPYNLHTIETGTFGLDGGAMFGVVPKPLWERRIRADDRNRIPLAMRCLLLEGEGRLILVDNGIGDKSDDKFKHLYRVSFEPHSLAGSLHRLGYTFDDVTDVVLTHLHFDHCGGSTRRIGDRLEVAFSNATYHVQLGQWASANAPNARERASFLPENLEPLAESGQLTFVDGNEELFDGVFAITVDGHTDRMQLIKVADQKTTLVFAADLLPTRHHLAAPWTMAYDIKPLISMDEKERFLSEAVAGGWQLFFEHDHEVEVASVTRGEKSFEVVHPRPLTEL